jgi:hypothetical protein
VNVQLGTARPVASVPAFRAAVDHSEPLSRRFGGWFVTGSAGSTHMGNTGEAHKGEAGRPLASVEGLFDRTGYRALSSDIVAHLVFAHQAA